METKANIISAGERMRAVENAMRPVIVGQDALIRRMVIALFTGGHILLEGVPGLGKTLAVSTFAKLLDMSFARVSFTPDLLPSDLVGSEVYRPADARFVIRRGPIFAHILLADEINRAPAKVQSALLEAMQERRVTIADETATLPDPFMVLATQNPIEQEGTYPLPEAQLDRFLFRTIITYPTPSEELRIMRATPESVDVCPILRAEEVISIRRTIAENVYISDALYEYIRAVVSATRADEIAKRAGYAHYIHLGASPRASVSFVRAARTLACLSGRDYVIPEDVKELAYDILRHRIVLSFEAMGEGITSDEIVRRVLDTVIVP